MSTFATTPVSLLSWLRYTSIISDRLKSICQKVEMQILAQQWIIPGAWEKAVFSIQTACFQRDILMLGEGSPCWFARTLIPEQSMEHDKFFFEQLQHKPLSYLIYDEPRVFRVLMHSYSIDKHYPEYAWLAKDWHQCRQMLWVRRSTFQLDKQHAFYLTEVFLPALDIYL